MNKKIFMSLTIALAIIMTSSTLVMAAHEIPNSGGKLCNNTYTDVSHSGSGGGSSAGSHTLSNGIICSITQITYTHKYTCTSCKTVLSQSTFSCQTVHNNCSQGSTTCGAK